MPAGAQGHLRFLRSDRFGNVSARVGGGLSVSGHGPGRLESSIWDNGDGTTDVRSGHHCGECLH